MARLPDPDTSVAILIGTHSYIELDNLPAVERNLEGLREVFTDRALWGLRADNCVLLPQPSSPREVLDTIGRAGRHANDTVIVYYAGHGMNDPYTDELCLALPDTALHKPYTALRYEYIRRLMLDRGVVRALGKIIILDCCFSGRALVGGMSVSTAVADQSVVEGTFLLTASAETRKAISPPGERYTAFTGELISTLIDGVPEGPALLDMETIYRYLYASLEAKSRPLPQQRNRNAGGLIALARNTARRPERSGPDLPDWIASTSNLFDTTDAARHAPSVNAQPFVVELLVVTVFMQQRSVYRRTTERIVKAQENGIQFYTAVALSGRSYAPVNALWGCVARVMPAARPGEPILTELWFPRPLSKGQRAHFASESIHVPSGTEEDERLWVNVEIDHYGIARGHLLYDHRLPVRGLTVRVRFDESYLPDAVWWYAEATEEERRAKPPEKDGHRLNIVGNFVQKTFTDQPCEPRENYGIAFSWPE